MSAQGTPSPTVSDFSSSGHDSDTSSIGATAATNGGLPQSASAPTVPEEQNGTAATSLPLHGANTAGESSTTQPNTASIWENGPGPATQQTFPSQALSASADAASGGYSFYFLPPPPMDPTSGELHPSLLDRLNPAAVPDDSIRHIVDRLLSPPDYLYNAERTRVTIDIVWAIGIIGREHFHSSCVARASVSSPGQRV
ncbi:uncharacterized protein EI97DRAFT_438236 [Westerdykella ornata]|uniref:Uncharacterized protein n=1 Tax=Westerdykella ornata TaxID=318751 RepID=A0A6A6JX38_WESOR|nr:uncharacterized protein EI97DRAFT_438236 [Westerdykella ornata]KAF2280795.1 hypothetical protein EI97DRAFT_438236 [Westerdykella ornata]